MVTRFVDSSLSSTGDCRSSLHILAPRLRPIIDAANSPPYRLKESGR
jgi:hypothetical protein